MRETETPAFQALLAKGRECGKVTYDELNEALPDGSITVDQLEAVMMMMHKAGIAVVE